MRDRTRRTSAPKIFIDGQHIGGYYDMAALDATGELDLLLFGSAAPR
jgi:glutaredoxin